MIDIKNLYEMIGSDYRTVLERFSGHEDILVKFVGAFLDDVTFGHLAEAVKDRNDPEIESQAHALKGVSGNLGFERLHMACGELVSCVRFDRLDEVSENYRKVEEEYGIVCKVINDIMNSGNVS